MKAAIEDIMQACGITDEMLGKRMHEGLNATLVHQETKYSRREVLVDFHERREMCELVLRLKGYLVDRHHVEMVKTLEEILEESRDALGENYVQ